MYAHTACSLAAARHLALLGVSACIKTQVYMHTYTHPAAYLKAAQPDTLLQAREHPQVHHLHHRGLCSQPSQHARLPQVHRVLRLRSPVPQQVSRRLASCSAGQAALT